MKTESLLLLGGLAAAIYFLFGKNSSKAQGYNQGSTSPVNSRVYLPNTGTADRTPVSINTSAPSLNLGRAENWATAIAAGLNLGAQFLQGTKSAVKSADIYTPPVAPSGVPASQTATMMEEAGFGNYREIDYGVAAPSRDFSVGNVPALDNSITDAAWEDFMLYGDPIDLGEAW